MLSLLKETSVGNYTAAWRDMVIGLMHWRVWGALATSELRSRYRRSAIGQFWITISMAVMIFCLAFVYSAIFHLDLSTYLPTMAMSFIVWSFIASIVTDSANAFIEAEPYLRSSSLPRTTFIYKNILRNLLSFAHNLILALLILALFGPAPTAATLLFLPALGLLLVNGLSLGMVLGTLCVRFRDLPPIVASAVQIAFFASPIIWGRAQITPDHHYIIDWNPFAIFLELLREPLLGQAPLARYWICAILITLLGGIGAFSFFARFRARIAYYV